MNRVRRCLEQTDVLRDGVAHVAVGFQGGPATDVEVPALADHAEKGQVVWVHARPPDRGGPRQTPFAVCAAGGAYDVLRPDLALPIRRAWLIIVVVARQVSDPAHQL